MTMSGVTENELQVSRMKARYVGLEGGDLHG